MSFDAMTSSQTKPNQETGAARNFSFETFLNDLFEKVLKFYSKYLCLMFFCSADMKCIQQGFCVIRDTSQNDFDSET